MIIVDEFRFFLKKICLYNRGKVQRDAQLILLATSSASQSLEQARTGCSGPLHGPQPAVGGRKGRPPSHHRWSPPGAWRALERPKCNCSPPTGIGDPGESQPAAPRLPEPQHSRMTIPLPSDARERETAQALPAPDVGREGSPDSWPSGDEDLLPGRSMVARKELRSHLPRAISVRKEGGLGGRPGLPHLCKERRSTPEQRSSPQVSHSVCMDSRQDPMKQACLNVRICPQPCRPD